MSEIKKPVAQEINDDELKDVNGGAYSVEEWNKMSTQERIAAQQKSVLAKRRGEPCDMD